MGSQSGYDCLFPYLEKEYTTTTFWAERNKKLSFAKKLKKRLRPISFAGSTPFYNYNSYLTEKSLIKTIINKKPSIVHVAYLENSYWLLSKQVKKLKATKIIATIHQPPSWWKIYGDISLIKKLDALIVLDIESKKFFEKYLPNKVYLIHHGIDTNYFNNSNAILPNLKHCVFAGHNLRNIKLLTEVIIELAVSRKDIVFDIIFPKANKYQKRVELFQLASSPNVNWYSNITDIQLRKIYQSAQLLFLPLIDSTANNSLLESMACGLPIVTSNIPSIKSYTNKNFTTYCSNFDTSDSISAIEELIDNPTFAKNKGLLARRFAEQNFSWPIIVEKTLNLYQKIIAEI